MSRNKKPRDKAYKRKPVNKNAMFVAINGTRKFTEPEKAAMIRPLHFAFEELREGKMTKDTWTTLAAMLNTAVCLGMENIAPNFKPVYDATIQAMMELRHRLLEDGRVTAYPAQLRQIEEAIALFLIQLDLCTYREYFRATEEIQYREVATPQTPEKSKHSYVHLDYDTIRETDC